METLARNGLMTIFYIKVVNIQNGRSSHHRYSVKKVFLKISQNSHENTCPRVFFNKNTDLRPATLIKKTLWHMYFPVNFAKFLRIPFFHRTSVAASGMNLAGQIILIPNHNFIIIIVK